jgi:hypothetical protein
LTSPNLPNHLLKPGLYLLLQKPISSTLAHIEDLVDSLVIRPLLRVVFLLEVIQTLQQGSDFVVRTVG